MFTITYVSSELWCVFTEGCLKNELVFQQKPFLHGPDNLFETQQGRGQQDFFNSSAVPGKKSVAFTMGIAKLIFRS